MIQVVEIYNIEDYKKWTRFYEQGEGERRAIGSREAFVYQNREKGDEILVIHNWDTMEQAKGFFESEEFRNRMKDAGIRGEPVIQYFKEVDRIIG